MEHTIMRSFWSVFLIAVILPSCSHEPPAPEPGRSVITPESLAVTVETTPRSFFLSDKRGGFLVGTAAGSLQPRRWSAAGQPILSGFALTVDGMSLFDTDAERIVIAPHQIEAHYAGDLTLRLSLLGFRYADSWLHAFIIRIVSSTQRSLEFRPQLRVAEWKTLRAQESLAWEADGKRYLCVSGGPAGRASAEGLLLDGITDATILVVYGNIDASDSVSQFYERLDGELRQRDERLTRLLNDHYVQTGNPRLNRALWWSRATLDALVVESDDTSAVPGLPWDGSFSGRTVAHSLSGISVANSDPRVIRALIRWLARRQDTVSTSTTYGRIAARFVGSGNEYTGADVGPDFVRQMYEIVSKTNDTSLVRELYPTVWRGIEGTLRYHTDTLGFLTHGGGETWMESRPLSRGNRAVEVQTSWYYQQLISSFMAAQMRDTSAYRKWSSDAARTLSSFNRVFIDSSANLVYDHVTSAGLRVREWRPNALFSIDLLNAEKIQQNIIINTMKNNVYRHGVATLADQDSRFTPYVPPGGRGAEFYNGPIWTWLSGQAVYSLSRYDRQDLAFHITEAMIDRVLDRGMVGAVPALMDTRPRDGSNVIAEGGVACSLDGIAEFIRSFYQDYAGITVDASSNELSLHPKLPAGVLPLDCTVLVGSHPVRVTYRTIEGTLRVALSAPALKFPLKVAFLLMIENGDAWQGLTLLEPGRNLVLALNSEQVTAFRGTEEISPGSVRHLKGFSQRSVFTDLHFADEQETTADQANLSGTND
jgi:Amylo-alpha-1,6-glucosidase